MRTRRACYPSPDEAITFTTGSCRQKRRLMSAGACSKGNGALENPFDALHDDLLISIMAVLSASANSPADLANAKLTCKRFCSAASNRKVLSEASMAALTVKASKWNEDADKFLKLCADAGNREACYMLGMIRFYCVMNRGSGLGLMAEAAIASHPCALYSLAVIKFNGSGGFRKDKVLKAGVVLCAKAAAIGHLDAMRELGHCLQDGYGVKKNAEEGRKLLLEANAREEAAYREAMCCMHGFDYALSDGRNPSELNSSKNGSSTSGRHDRRRGYRRISSQNDFVCNSSPANFHAINTFLVEWFALHPPAPGLRLCSHSQCGRPETRKHEFRRCSACGSVHYCSRACQALDWKMKHRYDCNPAENWDEQ